MLSQQIVRLHEALNIKGKEIAEYAGFSAPLVSNLKNGIKKPKKDSTIIIKYTDAVCRLAKDTQKRNELCALLGVKKSSKDKDLRIALIEWLYSPSPAASSTDPAVFALNLRSVMSCLDLTAVELSALLSLSQFQVGRMLNKNSKKMPDDETINRICCCLAAVIAESSHQVDMCRLLGCPLDIVSNKETCAEYLRTWLCFSSDALNPGISGFLSQISTIAPAPPQGLLPVDEIREEILSKAEENVYYGMAGLQEAVLRFLNSAINTKKSAPSGKTELMLYSDQDMGWMTDPGFQMKWAAMMTECLRLGIKIKIIHNIDRRLPEMISAIRLWLPLYMSGLIEPYYSKHKNGDSFAHSFFLNPMRACVCSANPAGFEANGIYRYDTDRELLSRHKKQFSMMLKDSGKLLYVRQGAPNDSLSESLRTLKEFPDIAVALTHSSAVIVKKTDPQTVFTLYHPLLKNAFGEYIKTLGN